MSFVIEPCHGTVHVFQQGTGGSGVGLYSVESLPVTAGDGGRIIISGVSMELREIVQPSITLDDVRTLFYFGSGWNQISVNGLLLLGPGQGSSGGQILATLQNWYDSNRVSASNQAVTISLGAGGPFTSYVIGLSLGSVDPTFCKQAFTINALTSKK